LEPRKKRSGFQNSEEIEFSTRQDNCVVFQEQAIYALGARAGGWMMAKGTGTA